MFPNMLCNKATSPNLINAVLSGRERRNFKSKRHLKSKSTLKTAHHHQMPMSNSNLSLNLKSLINTCIIEEMIKNNTIITTNAIKEEKEKYEAFEIDLKEEITTLFKNLQQGSDIRGIATEGIKSILKNSNI